MGFNSAFKGYLVEQIRGMFNPLQPDGWYMYSTACCNGLQILGFGEGTEREKEYSFILQNIQTEPLPHPDICSVDKGESADRGIAAGIEADLSPPNSVKVVKMYLLSPMFLHGVHKDK